MARDDRFEDIQLLGKVMQEEKYMLERLINMIIDRGALRQSAMQLLPTQLGLLA